MISKIISSKISIDKLNYKKNNYLYLTLGCKGLEMKIQDIPQGSQYHAVVHQCVLYHGNLKWILVVTNRNIISVQAGFK